MTNITTCKNISIQANHSSDIIEKNSNTSLVVFFLNLASNSNLQRLGQSQQDAESNHTKNPSSLVALAVKAKMQSLLSNKDKVNEQEYSLMRHYFRNKLIRNEEEWLISTKDGLLKYLDFHEQPYLLYEVAVARLNSGTSFEEVVQQHNIPKNSALYKKLKNIDENKNKLRGYDPEKTWKEDLTFSRYPSRLYKVAAEEIANGADLSQVLDTYKIPKDSALHQKLLGIHKNKKLYKDYNAEETWKDDSKKFNKCQIFFDTFVARYNRGASIPMLVDDYKLTPENRHYSKLKQYLERDAFKRIAKGEDPLNVIADLKSLDFEKSTYSSYYGDYLVRSVEGGLIGKLADNGENYVALVKKYGLFGMEETCEKLLFRSISSAKERVKGGVDVEIVAKEYGITKNLLSDDLSNDDIEEFFWIEFPQHFMLNE